MKSVATRLFMVFFGLMVGLLVLTTLASGFLLKPYYVRTNQELLATATSQVAEAIRRGEGHDFIRNLDRSRSISVIIADAGGNVLDSSFVMGRAGDAPRLPGELMDLIRKAQTRVGEKSVYQTVADQEFGVEQLALVTRLASGDFVILRKSMSGIDESTAISNRFLLFSGVGIILLGSAIVFTFSRRLTRPVVKMSQVADSLANLDFSRRVAVSSQDEIGALARSINRMAERLDSAIDGLKADVERRQRLVRDMSHELKTPIGIIKGYAEALKYGLSDDTDRYCTVIAAEVDRMDQMVKDLLSLSQLEAGGTELKRLPFAAGQLLARLVERFGPVAEAKGVTVIATDPGGLQLLGDFTLLERAVGNFVTNAIRHTPEGGRIEITVREHNDREFISVFNTGSSISDEDLPHLWDVFYRTDRARGRDSGGHGLGLSIAKRIATLHGGDCGVRNSDNGVTFWLGLPSITSR